MTRPKENGPVLFKPGFVADFLSGGQVRATPEEVEAVQVFTRRLVEDFGYPRGHIQAHPQFRVRRSPSDRERSYPIDIAVFSGANKREQNLFLIVECKSENEKDGIEQLHRYLDMSPAELGVWFNGREHRYLRKVLRPDGGRIFQELPSIPRYGQRIEDIGLFKRRDLKKASNLKAVFKDIRNHLAGNLTGITRDEALAQEIISVLFCKIYDEVNTGLDAIVTFRNGQGEPDADVRRRILGLFDEVKKEYSDVFQPEETIKLDAEHLAYVVGELQNYCVIDADRDAIGDAFEVFIGPALRGAEGQFFTPRNVVRMMIEILDPAPGEALLDPACGSGGFLIMALEHVWRKLETEAEAKGWSPVQLERKKRDAASRFFRGMDKDSFLAKVTKAYMAIVGDGRGGVFCQNSLLPESEWNPPVREKIKLASFDVVLTNPPFGAKIPIKGSRTLAQYDLGFKWKRGKETQESEKTATLHEERPPQLMFLERCLQFVKPGGRLGIVLPESLLGNPSYEYVLNWLCQRVRLLGVVTLPEVLFKTSGKGGTHCKTCVLFMQKITPPADYSIFMADAKWCGHDSRGNPTLRAGDDGQPVLLDDVPLVAKHYASLLSGRSREQNHLGFVLNVAEVQRRILVPKYYDPELFASLQTLELTHDMITVGGLVASKALGVATGVEVGKMAYGTGVIPFVRTSDISNWELKADPKQGISEALYESLKDVAGVQPRDILLVRDGTYLIGTSAIITKYDPRLIFQSHILRIRVLKPKIINPWLLFACLNSPVVKLQIRAKQFTQDIIDTLGTRLMEVRIPVPKDPARRAEIARSTRRIVEERGRLRTQATRLSASVAPIGIESLDEELPIVAENDLC